MEKSFTPSEIVEFAIKIEENGIEFYETMVNKIKQNDAKELFNFLAEQELKHKNIFQGFLSSIDKLKPQGNYTEEYFSYLKTYADENVFSKGKKGQLVASRISSPEEAIDFGIEIEKDSIHFYLELEKLVPKEKSEIVQKVIQEERKHYMKFLGLKKLLKK